MREFQGGFPLAARPRSAVQVKMLTAESRPQEIWTAAKVQTTLDDARAALEAARKDSLELRTIKANADAVKNVTSGGGPRTLEARIARALHTLNSGELRARSGVTQGTSGKYEISPEAIVTTKRFKALAGSTTKLVEATLSGKAELLAKRDQKLQAISAKERAEALEKLRVSLNEIIDSHPAFKNLRSSFRTKEDTGSVTMIREGLTRIAELEAKSKFKEITKEDLKDARSIYDNLRILELPKYKQKMMKAQKQERQVPAKEALADITMMLANIDRQLQERNWSASPVKNTEAKTAVGKVAHLRFQLDKTAKKIEAAGDAKVDGLWLALAKKQYGKIQKIFDAELQSREMMSSKQNVFDLAYAIAKEKFGDVRPSNSKKGNSPQEQVEFLLGTLQQALRNIDSFSAHGLSNIVDLTGDESMILSRIQDLTGIQSPTVKEPANEVSVVTDAQKVDDIYEKLRDIVKQGDGTWKGLRSAVYVPADRLDTPQGKVAQAMTDLINLKLEADKNPVVGKNYEAEASKIMENAQQVISNHVASELVNAYDKIQTTAKAYWEDIEPAKVYEANVDKTRVSKLLGEASELASKQENLVDLSLVAQSKELGQRVDFIVENAHKVDAINFDYDSEYDTAKESFNFPEGHLPQYNPHAKTPQEKIESALGSIRGYAEMAEIRRNMPGDGEHIDDSWMSAVADQLGIINKATPPSIETEKSIEPEKSDRFEVVKLLLNGQV